MCRSPWWRQVNWEHVALTAALTLAAVEIAVGSWLGWF